MTPSPLSLFLIRHAEVEERYKSVFGGRIDMDLSPVGRTQAQALATCVRAIKPHAIYASPMKRVQQTLAPLLGDGLPGPVTVDDLREIDFGSWTGLAWEDVRQRFGISPFEWLSQIDCSGIHEAECTADLEKRLRPRLNEIVNSHPGERVAVYSHGGVIRVLLAFLLNIPIARMAGFEIDYASVTRVDVINSRPRVQLLNYRPWSQT
jgi:broad specificity phosphatase PhoE